MEIWIEGQNVSGNGHCKKSFGQVVTTLSDKLIGAGIDYVHSQEAGPAVTRIMNLHTPPIGNLGGW